MAKLDRPLALEAGASSGIRLEPAPGSSKLS